jgi:iron-sulfur cluster repair protein YtfE (RIC family)
MQHHYGSHARILWIALQQRQACTRLLSWNYSVFSTETSCFTSVTSSDRTDPTCLEREWISRPLTELIAHIGERYRGAIERRFDTVGLALAEASAPSEPLASALTILRETFTALDEHVGAHMKIEFDVLFPTIIALEHPQVLAVRQSAAFVGRLTAQVTHDHANIRSLLETLDRAIEPSLAHSLVQSPQFVMLIADVLTLTLTLRQQLELEDRCLWPRALELFSQLP